MRVSTICWAALPVVQALVVQPKEVAGAYSIEKRQSLATLTHLLGRGGKVSDPPNAAPRRQLLQTTSKQQGASRVKLRYGPYSVPGMNKTSLQGQSGALWNYPDMSIAKPCSECIILGQWAGLEYPDGANANIDTGMWLHHMVHFVSGPTRWDPTCSGRLSLPHFGVNETPGRSERYFSSGNERTRAGLEENGIKAGVQLRARDRYEFIIDLMNMNTADKTVYVTMTYDILNGPMPQGWRELKTVWLDARQCGTSEVQAPRQSGSFTIASRPWVPNFDGDVMAIGGHLHDGGVHADVHFTNGKSACVSKAAYGESPEYQNAKSQGHTTAMSQATSGHSHGAAPQHISSMSVCINGKDGKPLPVTALSKDQSWTVNGLYDYDKFPGNTNEGGKQDEIMAIALIYVAIPPGGGERLR